MRMRLDRPLKGFSEADTRSASEGWLEPGTYVVTEHRTDASGQSDYARLLVPKLEDGDTWICFRSYGQSYATLLDPPATSRPDPLDFTDDPLAVPERALTDLLPRFHAFTYVSQGARYPHPLEGAPVPLAPPHHNNCCTFVEGLLVRAWQDIHGPTAPWSRYQHDQMMIRTGDGDFFSPVTAIVDAGWGVRIEAEDDPPHPWTVVQGWKERWRRGHTFIVVDYHEATGRVLVLESNGDFGVDGVGLRGVANLRDLPGGHPPERWWTDTGHWTWERIRGTFRHRACAALKVTAREWVPEPG